MLTSRFTTSRGAFTIVLFLAAAGAVADLAGAASQPLDFTTLADHIGPAEEVDLAIYFLGFPRQLHPALSDRVREFLHGMALVDAKPWWIPNMPKYGAPDFAMADAPPWLPPELVPPDGKIRYDSRSMVLGPGGLFLPVKELPELVDDWHHNADAVYNIEHDGALVGVPWKVDEVAVHFLPATQLEPLYARLEASRRFLESSNPPAELTLYSYNELFDWLRATPQLQERKAGATLIFVNLQRYADLAYSFCADPQRDLVPAPGGGPAEVQYPPATASTPERQSVANLMTLVLGGGLTQAKMMAAVEVYCDQTTTVEATGLPIPGARPTQSICASWSLRPIHNLLGNKGTRIFLSDATRHLAQLQQGDLDEAGLLAQVEADLFELVRYGVLQPSIKGNNVYSEAYELRTLVLDLRYDRMDLCLLERLNNGMDPSQAVSECQAGQASYPTEKTYTREDVFDAGLASTSLAAFNPGRWEFTFRDFPFGVRADGSYDPVQAAVTKQVLRDQLDEPTLPDPQTGQPVTLKHPPLYRKLLLPHGGDLVELTSSWEKGVDSLVALHLLVMDRADGGLGVYQTFWPEARAVGARPCHQTGSPVVKPLTLILTPAPGGPRGEKWGTFPFNNHVVLSLGFATAFGGGGWWTSVGGNEEAGGLARRDYLMVLPQYFLGKTRGNGERDVHGVMPDGTVRVFHLPALSLRPMEVGAPHWCDQFDAVEPVSRAACREFVRTTTTLQAIETLQHGLGYLHSPEPRKRFHYDGQLSTIARLYELSADPSDQVGLLLHQLVNQYTTLGISTVWGQDASEWNGVGPHAGMQATLFRSHAREEMRAAEEYLRLAIDRYQAGCATDGAIQSLLQHAIAVHARALREYDDWEYPQVIHSAMEVLSLLDRALTRMGSPDLIHDPLTECTAGS